MLYTIEPFIIFQQNDYGPTTFHYEEEDRMDITRIPRGAFLDYFYRDFDIDNPTKENSEQRRLQWARRHPTSPQNGGGTSSASSQNGQSAPSSANNKKKSDSMKKSIGNYVSITDDRKFKKWIDDVTAIAKAEAGGTSKVLDPDFTPTPDQEVEFAANKRHIYAMLCRHGNTGIIGNILSKTTDGQEAMKMIMLEYSDQHAGNKLNTVKIPKEHNGQVAACMRKFEETIDEHNSMVGKNLKIDERSKLEKLKDMMSHIDKFDAVEDTLLLSDNADSMPAENIVKLYMRNVRIYWVMADTHPLNHTCKWVRPKRLGQGRQFLI